MENEVTQKSSVEDRLLMALELLERVVEVLEDTPDKAWWREYFLLTGRHMILTDEGWEPGSCKKSYLDDWQENPDFGNPILDEVNAP